MKKRMNYPEQITTVENKFLHHLVCCEAMFGLEKVLAAWYHNGPTRFRQYATLPALWCKYKYLKKPERMLTSDMFLEIKRNLYYPLQYALDAELLALQEEACKKYVPLIEGKTKAREFLDTAKTLETILHRYVYFNACLFFKNDYKEKHGEYLLEYEEQQKGVYSPASRVKTQVKKKYYKDYPYWPTFDQLAEDLFDQETIKQYFK